MTNDELVARQARRIAELEDKLAEYEKACDDIYSTIYCIGGPLNDNILCYTHAQMGNFYRIAQFLPDPLHSSN